MGRISVSKRSSASNYSLGFWLSAASVSGLMFATLASAQQAAPPKPLTDAQVQQKLEILNDRPNMKRFRSANAALMPPAADEKRVVFMGDSITEAWMHNGVPGPERTPETDPGFFPGKPYVNRGISGQTSPQMLVRFRQDVVDLKPRVVVILAGTNDVAGNTGPMTPEETEENLSSMADIASKNGIRVVLCSILPAFDFPWKSGMEPAPKIIALNQWIKTYAASKGYVYVDYYSAMVDKRGGLPANLSHDGVHPTKAGYDIMDPLVEAGIAKALESR